MAIFEGTVLVLGANGETGKRVVANLHAKGISVRAMVRDATKAEGLASSTTEIFVGNVLNLDDLRRAMSGCRALISTLGTKALNNPAEIEAIDYTAIIHAIQIAKEVGLDHFILCSSIGTDNPEAIPFLAAPLRAKRRAEEALLASGLSYTIVHPGGLRNDPGGQGVLVSHTPLRGGTSITRDDVAEVLVQALLQPEARNASVYILQVPGEGLASRTGLFKR